MGATVIWLTSTSTNTYVAGSDLFIPSTDEDGAYVDGDGRMTDTASSAARSSTPMEALARRIAAEVLTRLDEVSSTGVNFRLATTLGLATDVESAGRDRKLVGPVATLEELVGG